MEGNGNGKIGFDEFWIKLSIQLFFREALYIDKSKLNTLSWSEIKRQIDSSNISVVIVADDRYSNSLKKNTFLPSYPLHHVT